MRDEDDPGLPLLVVLALGTVAVAGLLAFGAYLLVRAALAVAP